MSLTMASNLEGRERGGWNFVMQIPKQQYLALIKCLIKAPSSRYFFFFFIPGTLFLFKAHLEALTMGSRNNPYRKSGTVVRLRKTAQKPKPNLHRKVLVPAFEIQISK